MNPNHPQAVVEIFCYLNIFFAFRMRRTYSAITAVIFGVYWSSILFQMTAIYSLTLVLVEKKELESHDLIK